MKKLYNKNIIKNSFSVLFIFTILILIINNCLKYNTYNFTLNQNSNFNSLNSKNSIINFESFPEKKLISYLYLDQKNLDYFIIKDNLYDNTFKIDKDFHLIKALYHSELENLCHLFYSTNFVDWTNYIDTKYSYIENYITLYLLDNHHSIQVEIEFRSDNTVYCYSYFDHSHLFLKSTDDYFYSNILKLYRASETAPCLTIEETISDSFSSNAIPYSYNGYIYYTTPKDFNYFKYNSEEFVTVFYGIGSEESSTRRLHYCISNSVIEHNKNTGEITNFDTNYYIYYYDIFTGERIY